MIIYVNSKLAAGEEGQLLLTITLRAVTLRLCDLVSPHSFDFTLKCEKIKSIRLHIIQLHFNERRIYDKNIEDFKGTVHLFG